MNIRLLNRDDAQKVAEVHLDGFSHFFLSSFGKRFLTFFYRAIFQHPHGYGIGAFDEDCKVIGFSVGCFPSTSFYKSLFIGNCLSLLPAMLPTILKSPSKLIRLLKAFKTSSKEGSTNENSAILLSICVKKTIKGKGIGKKLLDAFEKESICRKAKTIKLTTQTENNDNVNAFYQRNGYELVRMHTKYDEIKENIYLKKIQV